MYIMFHIAVFNFSYVRSLLELFSGNFQGKRKQFAWKLKCRYCIFIWLGRLWTKSFSRFLVTYLPTLYSYLLTMLTSYFMKRSILTLLFYFVIATLCIIGEYDIQSRDTKYILFQSFMFRLISCKHVNSTYETGHIS